MRQGAARQLQPGQPTYLVAAVPKTQTFSLWSINDTKRMLNAAAKRQGGSAARRGSLALARPCVLLRDQPPCQLFRLLLTLLPPPGLPHAVPTCPSTARFVPLTPTLSHLFPPCPALSYPLSNISLLIWTPPYSISPIITLCAVPVKSGPTPGTGAS